MWFLKRFCGTPGKPGVGLLVVTISAITKNNISLGGTSRPTGPQRVPIHLGQSGPRTQWPTVLGWGVGSGMTSPGAPRGTSSLPIWRASGVKVSNFLHYFGWNGCMHCQIQQEPIMPVRWSFSFLGQSWMRCWYQATLIAGTTCCHSDGIASRHPKSGMLVQVLKLPNIKW